MLHLPIHMWVFVYFLSFLISNVHLIAEKPLHGLYIGMVNLDFSESGNSASVKVRVFYDDLQNGVRAAYPSKFRAAEGEQWLTLNRRLVEAYFREKLVFRLEGKPLGLLLKRGFKENDLYQFEFSLECPTKWESIRVRADFLTELFPSQSNVIQWQEGGGTPRFARATRQAPEFDLSSRD